MRSTVGIGHASAALQRLLDPLHPDPMGEAKRQIRHLTATELQETMTALLVLYRLAQEVERIAPTEIEARDHTVPDMRYYDNAGKLMVGRNWNRENR